HGLPRRRLSLPPHEGRRRRQARRHRGRPRAPDRSMAAMARADTGWRGGWGATVPPFLWLGLILVLAWFVFRYFILTFAVAGSVALLLAPAQSELTRRFRGSRNVAAAVLVLLVTLILLVPVLSYGTLIARQALGFFEWLRPQMEPESIERFWQVTLPSKFPLLTAWIRQASGGKAMPASSTILPRIAEEANHYLQVIFAGLASAVFDVTIFLMMLFFLLR